MALITRGCLLQLLPGAVWAGDEGGERGADLLGVHAGGCEGLEVLGGVQAPGPTTGHVHLVVRLMGEDGGQKVLCHRAKHRLVEHQQVLGSWLRSQTCSCKLVQLPCQQIPPRVVRRQAMHPSIPYPCLPTQDHNPGIAFPSLFLPPLLSPWRRLGRTSTGRCVHPPRRSRSAAPTPHSSEHSRNYLQPPAPQHALDSWPQAQ